MPDKEEKKVEFLAKETYLAVIQNSVGSAMFQNLYAKVDGEVKDITDDGDLSCAFYVSSVLLMFGLIKEGHATVHGLLREFENEKWEEIHEPKAGSVLVWEEEVDDKGDRHPHIGFYIGEEKALSSRPERGVVSEHHYTYGEEGRASMRKIEKVFHHLDL